MTFFLYLIVAGLLAYGWLTPNPIFAKVGAIIYLLLSAFSLIGTYQASKQYRNGEWEPENKKDYDSNSFSRIRSDYSVRWLIRNDDRSGRR